MSSLTEPKVLTPSPEIDPVAGLAEGAHTVEQEGLVPQSEACFVQRPRFAAVAIAHAQRHVIHGKSALVRVALKYQGRACVQHGQEDLGRAPASWSCQIADLDRPDGGHGAVEVLAHHLEVGGPDCRRTRKPELERNSRILMCNKFNTILNSVNY